MNAKHYVSLEAAKKLKELGYNELGCDGYYSKGILHLRGAEHYGGMVFDDEVIDAPTLLEAMDWIESKGIHFETRMMHCKVKGDPYKIADDDEYQWKWYFAICKDDDVEHPIVEEGEDGYVVMHTDRNECMQKAIEKALELL